MEARVHQELLSFLAQHSLEDTMSNIDDIVLSYLVGVVELVSQGDDGLDIVELMDMMNAYLPGFDQIGRSEVIDWMFGLASKLMGSNQENGHECSCKEDGCVANGKEDDSKQVDDEENSAIETHPGKEKKFPSYDYSKESGERQSHTKPDISKKDISLVNPPSHQNGHSEADASIKQADIQKDCGQSSGPVTFVPSSRSKPSSTFPLSAPPEAPNGTRRSKRKGRQLSCSSQDSQDDSQKLDGLAVEESQVRSLLEMFPAACTMEARHCLQLSAGDVDRAAQLIIDRQETGQAIKNQTNSRSTRKNHKVKKTDDYKLDDDSIKSCVLERYSFVDTEEDKKTYRPPPPKGEAKKLVRYRDGQVVSMKGERFSEVKKKEGDDLKSTYVNLKPARKYRFH